MTTHSPFLGVRGRRVTLSSGARLFLAGSLARGAFRLMRGRMRLERVTEDGRVVVLHTVRAGETFAEAALFADRYHCDAVAETRCEIVEFDKQTVVARLREDASAGLELSRELSRQLRKVRAMLEIRNVRPVEARIVEYLRLQPVESPEADRVRPLRQIAEELGVAPETFYRALKRLQAAGRVERLGRSLRLRSGQGERASGPMR